MSSSIDELEKRLSGLKLLAGQLQAETRLPSTSLDDNTNTDPLITAARELMVPLFAQLTIGTLLAAVLGEIDSVESAQRSLTHHH
ncbi:hypothetical protein [Undibacterium sp. RuRC25W]|uniref:hypothetical protein n=1 Tax=Undibacterium sp. RuRC25W TaxID=3413047 RepID=UPI003BF146A6